MKVTNIYFFIEFFYNHKQFSLILLTFILKINVIVNECDRNEPFQNSYSKSCSPYCSANYNRDIECNINNSIIKSQFPNNIIFIGGRNWSSFNLYSINGNLFFETYNSTKKKIFFGLDKFGRNYFSKGKLYYFDTNNPGGIGSNSIFVTDNKLYFLNLNGFYFTEIYDFQKGKFFSTNTEHIIGFRDYGYMGSLIYLTSNMYIYAGIYKYPIIVKFCLYLNTLLFDYKIESNIITKDEIKIQMKTKIISCYQIKFNQIIVCFFDSIQERDNSDNDYYYNIVAYTQDLKKLSEEKKSIEILEDYNTFIYCIYFTEKTGAFIYYKDYYPIIFFKEYDNNSFKNYFNEVDEIILDKYQLESADNKNDFIRISNERLGLFSYSKFISREKIYIVIIDIFKDNGNCNIKIRYYSINIEILLKYKLYMNMKVNLFNNFIAFGAGYIISEYNRCICFSIY